MTEIHATISTEKLIDLLLSIHKDLREVSLIASLRMPRGSSQNELARLYFAVGNSRHHLYKTMQQLDDLHHRIETSEYWRENGDAGAASS